MKSRSDRALWTDTRRSLKFGLHAREAFALRAGHRRSPTAVERATAGPRTRRVGDPTSDRQPPPALPSDRVWAFSERQLYHTYRASYVQHDGASWPRKVSGMIDP